MTPDSIAPAELDSLVERIHRWGLATPAVLFLELYRPLAWLSSQAFLVAAPLLAPLVGLDQFERLRGVLADDARYEALLRRIEARAKRDEEG